MVVTAVNYQQDMSDFDHYNNNILIEDGDVVTVGLPVGTLFEPQWINRLMDGGDEWVYCFYGDQREFTGSNDATFSIGGDLSIEPIINDAPYRIGDEFGRIKSTISG